MPSPNDTRTSAASSRNRATSPTGEVAQGKGPFADAEMPQLLDLVGVTSKSLERYQSGVRGALERIQSYGERVMSRSVRQNALEAADILAQIVINCDNDPDDIREEIALPVLARELAQGLEQYVDSVSKRDNHPDAIERLEATEKMVAEAVPWLRSLLERMKANDATEAHVRARVLSRVFESKRE